eukprot:m.200982 g.200982  ORF g.200982 m.200982 type:complete len:190 (+) comp14966_c0_seq19:278-847(+)
MIRDPVALVAAAFVDTFTSTLLRVVGPREKLAACQGGQKPRGVWLVNLLLSLAYVALLRCAYKHIGLFLGHDTVHGLMEDKVYSFVGATVFTVIYMAIPLVANATWKLRSWQVVSYQIFSLLVRGMVVAGILVNFGSTGDKVQDICFSKMFDNPITFLAMRTPQHSCFCVHSCCLYLWKRIWISEGKSH